MNEHRQTLHVARNVVEVEQLAPLWERVAWGGEQAELPYYTETLRRRDGAEPLAILVAREGVPVAAGASRVERRTLDARLGYLRLAAPRARVAQFVPGGVVAADADARDALVAALRSTLADGTVDALAFPALPVQSDLYRALARLGGPLERQRFVPSWSRRRLLLPPDFESFLASRSRKIRAGIRYDAKKLESALGDALRVEVHRDASEHARIVRDLDTVATATYQRALGAGFAATEERVELLGVALRHGWARAYLLYRGELPIAYWLCPVHGDTVTLAQTGYLPDWAGIRPGIYLLMRVIEDACADPALRYLDFGPGRSSYKRHFSSEAYEERNVLVFAPTLRARRINATRTLVLGTGMGARRALDALQLTDRVKSVWRRRLRSAAQ